MWQWWDDEMERRCILYRARALHDAYTKHQEAPTRPVPGYLEARAEAGLAWPRVETVAGQRDDVGWAGDEMCSRSDTVEQQQGMDAMVEWVMKELNEELFTELLQGFHAL
jgi:hypothetical protein